jgi:hypothetical protein
MELTLAHKEGMKGKEIKREHIRFGKAKDNNYTKLLAKERKILDILGKSTITVKRGILPIRRSTPTKQQPIERMWVPL